MAMSNVMSLNSHNTSHDVTGDFASDVYCVTLYSSNALRACLSDYIVMVTREMTGL